MAIELNKPEPDGDRYCSGCGKRRPRHLLHGTLIHWPDEKAVSPVKSGGLSIEPFSIWVYVCSYCRGARTRRGMYLHRNFLEVSKHIRSCSEQLSALRKDLEEDMQRHGVADVYSSDLDTIKDVEERLKQLVEIWSR